MGSPETGPEIFEASHSPEHVPTACLQDELAEIFAEGVPRQPRGAIVSEAPGKSGQTITELSCETCDGHCFVRHKNWTKMVPIPGEPGFNLEECVYINGGE